MSYFVTKKEFLQIIAQSILSYRITLKNFIHREFGEEASSEIFSSVLFEYELNEDNGYYHQLFTRWSTYYDFNKRHKGSAESLLGLFSQEEFHPFRRSYSYLMESDPMWRGATFLRNYTTFFSALNIQKEMLEKEFQPTQETLNFLSKIDFNDGGDVS